MQIRRDKVTSTKEQNRLYYFETSLLKISYYLHYHLKLYIYIEYNYIFGDHDLLFLVINKIVN